MAHTIDGNLSDWADSERIDRAAPVVGYQVFGTVENSAFVFGVTGISGIVNFGLDTDRANVTGQFYFDEDWEIRIFNGVASLYQIAGIDNFVRDLSASEFRLSADGSSAEIRIGFASLGETDGKANLFFRATGANYDGIPGETFVLLSSNHQPTGKPVITGLLREGQTLTADVAGIADAEGLGTGFTYQWQRIDQGGGVTDIAGANSSSYVVRGADAYSSLRVVAIYTDGEGVIGKAWSSVTAPIARNIYGRIYNDTAPDNDRYDTGEAVVGSVVTSTVFGSTAMTDSAGQFIFATPETLADEEMTFANGQKITFRSDVHDARIDLVNGTEIWTNAQYVTLVSGLNEAHLTGNRRGDLSGSSGDDRLYLNNIGGGLDGRAGSDWLYGGAGNDSIDGGEGNDTIISGGGSDMLRGGEGDDTYYAADAVVDLQDFNGTNTMYSTISRDLSEYRVILRLILQGEAHINATGSDDYGERLIGNGGNNILDGRGGSDVLEGRGGDDTYVLGSSNDTVLDSAGVDTITSTISRSLTNYAAIENLRLLGAANLNATGNALANSIIGNAGSNVLDGRGGLDALYGGAGNDTYVLGADADLVTDSAGTADIITSTIGRDLQNYTGIEQLRLLGSANVNAYGDAAANVLIGNSGNNVLWGRGGADKLYGGAGNDIYDLGGDKSDFISDSAGIDTIRTGVTQTLEKYLDIERLYLTGTANIDATGNNLGNNIQGNAGNNVIRGLNGNDSIQGGGGADRLYGGAGADYFVYTQASDSIASAFDMIFDFKDEGADKIKLTDVYAGILTFNGTSAFTGIGQVRLAASGSDVNVLVNLDANNANAELIFRLVGTTLTELSAADFLL